MSNKRFTYLSGLGLGTGYSPIICLSFVELGKRGRLNDGGRWGTTSS